MADDGFNGATISIASTGQTPLLDINYSESCAKVQVTGSADAEKRYVNGNVDKTVSFTVVGTTTANVGATGAISIVWGDAGSTTTTITTGIVTSISTSGSEDSPITTTIEVVPTPAA